MVFKKILFILILPFFLYAQWTDPRPKSIQLWHLNTSFFDSLGNVVRDSVAALSADGVTIVNDGTFKQKVFASITALKAATAPVLGSIAVVKDVGMFTYTDSTYAEDDIDYISASAQGYQWERVKTKITRNSTLDTAAVAGQFQYVPSGNGNESLMVYDGDRWEEAATYPFYGRQDHKHGNYDIGSNLVKWRHYNIRTVDTVRNTWRDTLLGFGMDVVWEDNLQKYALIACAVDEDTTAQIGVWTSDMIGNWTHYASNPILTPGTAGQWDDEGVTFPQLHKENGLWYMFYVGFPANGLENGESGIGIATADTVTGTWTRHVGNPVILAGDVPWVAAAGGTSQIYRPEIVKHKGKYYMFYNGGKYGDEDIGFSYADSILGTWTHVDTAVFGSAQTGNNQNADPDIHLIGDVYYMFFWSSGTPRIATTSYNAFPNGWTHYAYMSFHTDSNVRPVVFFKNGEPYCLTYSSSRKSINIFRALDYGDGGEQIAWQASKYPRWDETDGFCTHIKRSNSTSYVTLDGASMKVNNYFLKGRSVLFDYSIAFGYHKTAGTQADWRIYNEANGEVLASGSLTTNSTYSLRTGNKVIESNYFTNSNFLRIDVKVDNVADTAYVRFFDVNLIYGAE